MVGLDLTAKNPRVYNMTYQATKEQLRQYDDIVNNLNYQYVLYKIQRNDNTSQDKRIDNIVKIDFREGELVFVKTGTEYNYIQENYKTLDIIKTKDNIQINFNSTLHDSDMLYSDAATKRW